MSGPMHLVRVVAVVRKRLYKYKYTLLVQCPVRSLFVLQHQREVTGEILISVIPACLHIGYCYSSIAYTITQYYIKEYVLCMFVVTWYMYAENMVAGAVLSSPNVHWWATSQTAHLCQELPQTCPQMMPLMRRVVMKVCVLV